MKTATCDVAIVGAGIVGAACARAFAREKLSVALVESGTIGGGATAAGMGHVAVMDDSQPQFALTRYSQQLWRELAAELPDDCEFEPCGTLWVAADEEEMDAVRSKQRFYSERGVPAEALDAEALADAEPNLRPGLCGGLRVPGDCVVYPPCAARWLIEQAQDRNHVDIHAATAAELHDDGVRLSDGSLLSAGVTVNAAGAAASKLTPSMQVVPRKGHLIITDRYPGFLRHQLIELGYLKSAADVAADSVACNVQPRSAGQLLVGSSRQLGDETTTVDSGILGRMVDRAIEYVPGLAQLSVLRTWTGFRAATPDKLPLIGACPGYRRVYLAAGHEGLGITMALGTAELLVDQVVRRESKISREPYLPSRFDVNQPSDP